MARDPKAFGDALFSAVKTYLEKNLEPVAGCIKELRERVATLERKTAGSTEASLADVVAAHIDDGVLTVTLRDGNTKTVMLAEQK